MYIPSLIYLQFISTVLENDFDDFYFREIYSASSTIFLLCKIFDVEIPHISFCRVAEDKTDFPICFYLPWRHGKPKKSKNGWTCFAAKPCTLVYMLSGQRKQKPDVSVETCTSYDVIVQDQDQVLTLKLWWQRLLGWLSRWNEPVEKKCVIDV